ncbi:MAG: dienelactone hydrolase family protein [Acidimicrobiales bacterium]
MEISEEIVETTTADGEMAVLLKRPVADGAWPNVVIFHDAPGIRDAIHEFANRLAEVGYVVAIPDLYHRQGRMIGFEPADVDADPSKRDRIYELLGSLTDDGIQGDLDGALKVLGTGADDKLGCIGFCLGARAVFRTMMRFPDQFVAGATWHPSFLADDEPDSPHLTAAELKGSLYIGIGDADKIQSIEMHQRFFDAVEPLSKVSVEIFEGADHGFSWPGYATYHETAASVSWTRTLALFESELA